MVKTLLTYNNLAGTVNTASTVEYWTPGSGMTTLTTTEANADVKMQQAGTIANLYVRSTANTGTHVLKTRKSAADGGQSVTVNAVGVFEDTSNTVSISAADRLAYQTDSAANTCTLTSISNTFNATTDTVSILVCWNSNNMTTASTTWFAPLGGRYTSLTTTETFQKARQRLAGTFKKLGVHISANRAQATTFRLHKGGSNVNETVTITGGGAAGWYEDTTNTDTVTAADDFNHTITTGTGTDTLTINVMKVEFNSTNGDGQMVSCDSAGAALADATNVVSTISGRFGGLGTGSETNVKTKARVAFDLSQLTTVISQNDISSASTVKLRVNGADVTNNVSVTGSGTGAFSDTTHTDTVATGDDLNHFVIPTSVSGAHTLTVNYIILWSHITPSTNYTRAIDAESTTISDSVVRVKGYVRAIETETVNSTESISRLLASIRNPQETTTSTETLARMIAVNRSTATESTSINDSVVRSKGFPRTLTETVTSTESIARMLAATRNPVETTTIDDPLTRTLTLFRTITESTTISDAITRVKELPRSLVETVTSSDSVVRMLAATRAMTETTSISDLLARSVGRVRALVENVSVSDSVSRLLTLFRTMVETTTISDSVSRSVGRIRTLTENVSVSDSITRMLAATRTLVENTTVADTLNRIYNAIRPIATEVISITDSVVRVIVPAGSNFVRSITETVVVSDSVSRMLALTRALTETVNNSETLTRLLTLLRTISETVVQSDSVTRLLTLSRLISETTVVSDSVVRSVGRIRQLIENISITDSIARRLTATRAVTEIVAITDSLTKILTRFSIPTRLHNLKEYIISKYSISDPSL